ncbi:MAG: methyltransferase domain-containing protein [Methanobacteriota archaeon]|nr:MAG: methyltransferase domain-containing protein [Euryarchaeota archaeon]
MRENFATRLVCPRCRGLLRAVAKQKDDGDVLEGSLTCATCGGSYDIRGSIPRLVIESPGVRETQRSFGSQWRKRGEGRFENETLWGVTRDEELRLSLDALGLKPEEFRNRWVLDAGCGSGRLTRSLAALAGEVVGLDLAQTIDLVIRNGPPLPNLHLVQGNLLHIPLADDAFDVVWSSGVIHHTGDTYRAFTNLARVVRPGGRLYVWVYSSRKLSLYKYIRDAMRVSHRIPPNVLFVFCYALAPLLKVYHAGKLALRRIRNLPVTPRERQQGRIRTIAFELHDDLSPRFQSRHTPEEVLGWFQRAGFVDLEVVGEVGVRGIKAKPATGGGSLARMPSGLHHDTPIDPAPERDTLLAVEPRTG